MTTDTYTVNDAIYAQTRKRVEKVLDAMDALFGPFDREAIAALMDGAQDAVAEWLPKQVRKADPE